MAKVGDFGLSSRLYGSSALQEKTKKRTVGNPTWLAPEIMREEVCHVLYTNAKLFL
jgi:serine/threonine protein kinase